MSNASFSATRQIARAARKRGYIVTSVSGRRKWMWKATLQAPENGIAKAWPISATSKDTLLHLIETMPIVPRTELWQP